MFLPQLSETPKMGLLLLAHLTKITKDILAVKTKALCYILILLDLATIVTTVDLSLA